MEENNKIEDEIALRKEKVKLHEATFIDFNKEKQCLVWRGGVIFVGLSGGRMKKVRRTIFRKNGIVFFYVICPVRRTINYLLFWSNQQVSFSVTVSCTIFNVYYIYRFKAFSLILPCILI